MKRLALAVVFVGLSIGCADGEGSGGAGGGGSGGNADGGSGGAGGSGGIAPVVSEWSACREGTQRYECASVTMAFDPERPDAGTLPLYVRRLKADGESHGQLWLLQGGPGYSAAGLAEWAPDMLSGLGLDLYIPDYRGVGRSMRLSCPDDAIDAACLAGLDERGDGLAAFSTVFAARDVADAIGALRKPGERIYLWGESYGTWVEHQLLRVMGDRLDGVVMDGACPPGGCKAPGSDGNVDRVVQGLAAICGGDAFCRGKLGSDPWVKLRDVLARVDAGHCAEAVGDKPVGWSRLVVASLSLSLFYQPAAFAFVYRLDRCSGADVVAIEWFIAHSIDGTPADPRNSEVLRRSIVLSEFWDRTKGVAEVEAAEAGLEVSMGWDRVDAENFESWPLPLYDLPAEVHTWADVDLPILVLNGTLDAQTAVWDLEGLEAELTGPGQHFVPVSRAGHVTTANSYSSDGTRPCGAAIVRGFLLDPTGELDTSCAAMNGGPRFQGYPGLSQAMFGTDDLWE